MAPETSRSGPACRRRWGYRRAAGCAAALVLAVGLAGCGDDGRDLAEPDPAQTTTTRGANAGTGTGESVTTASYMQMSSPDFSEGSAIPTVYTCFGDDISPGLTLTDVPTGTAEVAIVVRDVDADGFIHWVISNIPAQGGGVTPGSVPQGAIEATNDFGTIGWRGPCPPSGTHNYVIQAYALAAPAGLTQGMPGDKAASIIEAAQATGVAAISVTATAQPGN